MWKSVSKKDSTKWSFTIHSNILPPALTEHLYSDSCGSTLTSRSGLTASRSSLLCVGETHVYITHVSCVKTQCAAMRAVVEGYENALKNT